MYIQILGGESVNNYQEIVSFTVNYLKAIGVDDDFISMNVEEPLFESVWVMKLPSVCILKENRIEKSGSNQTHIHVTGESMNFFFDGDEIENLTKSTEDEYVKIQLIDSNIAHLEMIKRANRDSRLESKVVIARETNLIESGTVKKLAYRTKQKPQVQLSKHSYDHPTFFRLRKGLFTGDLLVFFKNNNQDYWVVAIPSTYQEANLIEESTPIVSNSKASLRIETDYDASEPTVYTKQWRSVKAEDIGRFSSEENTLGGNYENETQSLYDLSEGIASRRERTIRHHGIVRDIAKLLENNNFTLYENPIDCLALRENALIFEVKTLDGTDSDEMKQVRAALGQLLYYETFALDILDINENIPPQKIALFESRISDDHIHFLEKYDCLVMWINENEEFVGYGTHAQKLLRILSAV